MDYVDLLQRSALNEAPQFSSFYVCFLIIARIIPVIALAPFFGARILPHTVKAVFALALMTVVLPKILPQITTTLYFDTTLILLFVKELFIGTILGFFLGLPFLIVSASGLLIDHQRGAASLMTNDPTIQNQSSPIGTLFNLILIMLFFVFNGPFYVVDTVLASYDLIPIDKFFNQVFFIPENPLRQRIDEVLGTFFYSMIQFAMPGLLVILMTDTFLGIINRLAPQVQITFLGMGLKSWLAILIVCIGWPFLITQLSKEIVIWLREFMVLVQELAVGAKELIPL